MILDVKRSHFLTVQILTCFKYWINLLWVIFFTLLTIFIIIICLMDLINFIRLTCSFGLIILSLIYFIELTFIDSSELTFKYLYETVFICLCKLVFVCWVNLNFSCSFKVSLTWWTELIIKLIVLTWFRFEFICFTCFLLFYPIVIFSLLLVSNIF